MEQLHAVGIFHEDLHKENVVLDNGVKFVDFEAATFQGDECFTERMRMEVQKLANVSGLGDWQPISL